MKYDIQAKASMHTGKKYSVKHNLRDYDKNKWNTDNHIDTERTALNKVLTHCELKNFFQDTFRESIEQYNEKNRNKHPDRITSVNEYYNKYKGHAQECIMQLGNHENYLQLVQQLGQERADTVHIEYLTKLYQQWINDNPSLRVFSAVIHMDETKDGTPHLHLDYLPVAESTRGLTVKVSMDGAMKELGFNRKTKAKDGQSDSYNDTPFKRWLAHQREQVESLADEYINVIPSQTFCKPRRQETWEWRATQKETLTEDVRQLTEDKTRVEQDIKSLKSEYQRYQEIQVADAELSQSIKVKKNLLGKGQTVIIDKADYDLLCQQALAYRTNIDKLKKENEIEKTENRIKNRSFETTMNLNKTTALKAEAEKKLKNAEKECSLMLKNAEYKANGITRLAKKQAQTLLDEADSLYIQQIEINRLLEETKRSYEAEKQRGDNIYKSYLNVKDEMKQKEKEHSQKLSNKNSQITALGKEMEQLRERNDELSARLRQYKKNISEVIKRMLVMRNTVKVAINGYKLPLPLLAVLKTTINIANQTAEQVPLDEKDRELVNQYIKSDECPENVKAESSRILKELQEQEWKSQLSDDEYISYGGRSR